MTLLLHLVAVVVALMSMATLVRFQTVDWPIVTYLPVVGTIIVTLNVLLMCQAVLAVGFGNEAAERLVRRLDRTAKLGVVALAACAIFVALNAQLDPSDRMVHRARVVDVGPRTVSAGVPIVYSWMRVRYESDEGAADVTFTLRPEDQRTFWRGESIVLWFREGRFGVRWVDRKFRDDEVYYRRVMENSPDAKQPWQELIEFLLLNKFPDEAARQSMRYIERYPSDGGFAYWAGDNMALQGHEDEAVALLTRAVALQPSRYTSFRLAWVLTRIGDPKRAMQVIDESMRLYPQAWEFPFLAGYNLTKTRDYDEAVRHLRRVEELHPGVPGVSRMLERLAGLHAAASTVP